MLPFLEDNETLSRSALPGISCYCMNENQSKQALYLGNFREGAEAASESVCFSEILVWLWVLEGRFEFTYYLRDSNYKIKPLEVVSVLLGTRQLGHWCWGYWCWAVVQRLPWELAQGYPPSLKGVLSQEKQGKGLFWVREGVLFVFRF